MQNRDSKVRLHIRIVVMASVMLSSSVVVINEADSLSRDAQAALRRTMEKYMANMRLILCANSTSKLIAPIKSRCLLMRVAAPDEEEVSTKKSNYFIFSQFDSMRIYPCRCNYVCSMSQRRRNLIFLQMQRKTSPKMLMEISEKHY